MKLRTLSIISALSLIALTSCNVTDGYVKTKFNGFWVLERANDQPVATDSRYSFVLYNDGTSVLCSKENNIWVEAATNWKYEGITFTMNDLTGDMVAINDTILLLSTADGRIQYRRVFQSKSPFLGTWQVIDDTDADIINRVRFVFDEAGAYEYQTLSDGVWSASGIKSGNWFIYQTLLVLNSIETSGTTAEMWDISLATVSGQKIWLQTSTDASGNVLHSRTLKFIE